MAVVLITGCSSGFGLLAAVEFARRGDTVFATMRNPDKAGALRDAASAAGVPVEVLQLDVNDGASVEKAVADVIARAGRLDVLVNNAGIGAVAAVEEFDDDETLAVFETNVFGLLRVTRAVLPHMREERSGTIVNVGSLAGVVSSPFRGIYSATKAAVESLTEALQYELIPWNINVCVVEPGFFDTSIGENRLPVRRSRTASSPYAEMLEKYEPAASAKPANSVRADPQTVANVIVDAAHADPPKRRYPVGRDAEALAPARKALPDEQWEQNMRRTLTYLDENAAP